MSLFSEHVRVTAIEKLAKLFLKTNNSVIEKLWNYKNDNCKHFISNDKS